MPQGPSKKDQETPQEKQACQKLQREKRGLASWRNKVYQRISRDINENMNGLKLVHTRNEEHDHLTPSSSCVHQQHATTTAASADYKNCKTKDDPATTVVKVKKNILEKKTSIYSAGCVVGSVFYSHHWDSLSLFVCFWYLCWGCYWEWKPSLDCLFLHRHCTYLDFSFPFLFWFDLDPLLSTDVAVCIIHETNKKLSRCK